MYETSMYEPIDTWEKARQFNGEVDFRECLIKELEEIKAEIEAYQRLWLLKEDVYKIIDNHINNLKEI